MFTIQLIRAVTKQKKYGIGSKRRLRVCEESDQPGHPPSLFSLCRLHGESLFTQLPSRCTAKLVDVFVCFCFDCCLTSRKTIFQSC